MKKLLLVLIATLLLANGFAFAADEAPTPRKMPRTPVNREALPDHKPAAPASRIVEGQATVVDTERLRISDVDLRLFGIVPPQLSASFGPQARATLDNLVTGQTITCMIRDRDQAGRFLATCHTPGNADLAVELLRRGLAVTARGSLGSTEFTAPYLAAEQAAQTQKIGLWSVITPAAAAVPETPKPVVIQAAIPPPAPAVIETKKEEKAAKLDMQTKSSVAAAMAPAISATSLAPMTAEDEAFAMPDPRGGFIRRYQLLVTGFIMLVTALSILTVISMQRRQEKRDEMKAIGAALRGELMAARAVCQARLKTISSDADDKIATWPRIRATLYQAYVGRLGFLGAELARQVASIYGQSSDYAAYYNSLSGSSDAQPGDAAPKKQALQTLVQHIEEVLPKLAAIEHTGRIAYGNMAMIPTPVKSVTMPAPIVQNPAAAAQPAATAAAEVTSSKPSPTPLWEAVRRFARDRFTEKEEPVSTEESDYATIIEQEMANLSFSEMGDDSETLPGNVTKFKGTGT